MGRGCWSGGMWQLPSPLPGPSLPCAAPACAPGEALLLWHGEREGLANRIRSCGISQHPWCSSMLVAVLCALANSAGSAQGSAYLPPTPAHCGPSPCGSSKLSHSKFQGRLGLSLLSLALPWGSPASSHHSEAFGCSWLSPACCSHHSFCMVRPQQPQLCPWEGQESSVVPVTQVLLACVNRHILA